MKGRGNNTHNSIAHNQRRGLGEGFTRYLSGCDGPFLNL